MMHSLPQPEPAIPHSLRWIFTRNSVRVILSASTHQKLNCHPERSATGCEQREQARERAVEGPRVSLPVNAVSEHFHHVPINNFVIPSAARDLHLFQRGECG